jgi:hypothetical protein
MMARIQADCDKLFNSMADNKEPYIVIDEVEVLQEGTCAISMYV